MKKKNKNRLLIFLTALISGGVVGSAFYITNGFKNFDLIKDEKTVVDETRVAISFHGTRSAKDVSAYVFMQIPDVEEAHVPFAWPGLMPTSAINSKEYDFVTYNGKNAFTIELTDLLPEGYDDFSNFIEDGGKLGVILSYMNEDDTIRIQSQDYFIEESGNHILSLPTKQYDKITSEIVKFEKYVYVEDEVIDKNSSSVNVSVNSSSSKIEEETSSSSVIE